jgi:hypothetical protein
MPKNNGKARKAWRKALADHNKRYWDKYEDKARSAPPPYIYPARGTRPNTGEAV